MLRAGLLFLMAAAALTPAFAEKYSGPRPTKPDVPFLLHANKLVSTEVAQAKEERGKKDNITYVVDGTGSSAKTPVPEPVFVIESRNIAPEKLGLYKFEIRNGRREVVMAQKRSRNGPKPLFLNVTRLGEGLYKVEASEILEPGEYSLSPEGTNQVFCFSVF